MTDEILNRTAALGIRLRGMRPTTHAGLRAKAAAVREVMRNGIANEVPSTVESMGDYHDLLAWSLVNDILAAEQIASA